MAGYVELHAHSAFSFLDGASLPEELVLRARDLGYQALALTDHDGLYGSMEFARTARAWGLQPITGAELTLGRGVLGASASPGRTPEGGFHLTLLAETPEGYANLCRLITLAFEGREKGDPRLDPVHLERHAAGLICLSGCRRGELARLVDAGNIAEATAVARRLAEWFGPDRFYIELQQTLTRGDTRRIRGLTALAGRLGLPLVATGNVHYHHSDRARLQDTLVAVRCRTTLEGCHAQRRGNREFYLRAPEEMEALFRDLPEAIRNTGVIAQRCQAFDLTRDLGYRFPEFASDRPEGGPPETADEALARITSGILTERYRDEPLELQARARERLAEELRLIGHHRLSGFFLVYRDLLRLAEEVAAEVRGPSEARRAAKLPPGRGRGSSVSSLVCYLIGLSHVDPIKANLFLGRFLNEEMRSVPDIDIDFARDIREQLILRVYERYGRDHAGLVCTFPTYRLKSAVREVGKALGLPEVELDRLSKVSEGGRASSLEEELAHLPEFQDRKDAPLWRLLVELAKEIGGFPRHVSQHVGGMIISSRPLLEMVPLEPARMDGRIVCQWDKDSCEDAGFIKVDFLSLGMLSLVEECVEHVYDQHGIALDLSRLDFTDPAVYDEICQADTTGVFQIESRAQMQLLPRTRPRNLEDLAIEIAIVRPGPIVGGAVNPYVKRRQEEREALARGEVYVPEYDHPLLEPALKETLGVVLFQDQVMEVAMALAGFSAGQADDLRRAMSRKRSREAMTALWDEFRDGAAAKGVSEETATEVFRKLVAFSEFGFPKSHSAAFAVLAFQSAWLRHYYPAEYYTALLNNQPMGFYPPHVLVHDAQRHGIAVLPVDANLSLARCSVEKGQVRVGLVYVRGLGLEAAEALEVERTQNGSFCSLDDFARRVRLRPEAMENLIRVGALDGFGLARRELLWQLGLLNLDIPVHRQGKVVARQLVLPLSTEQDMVALPEMQPWEKMAADYTVLEMSPGYHPIGLLRPKLEAANRALDAVNRVRAAHASGEARTGGRRARPLPPIVPMRHLESLEDGADVRVAGLVVTRQRPGTAKGFIFLLLEDETGVANVVVKPGLYEAQRAIVRAEPLLLLRATVQRRDGILNLVATGMMPLSQAREVSDGPKPPEQPRASQLSQVAPPAHNFG